MRWRSKLISTQYRKHRASHRLAHSYRNGKVRDKREGRQDDENDLNITDQINKDNGVSAAQILPRRKKRACQEGKRVRNESRYECKSGGGRR